MQQLGCVYDALPALDILAAAEPLPDEPPLRLLVVPHAAVWDILMHSPPRFGLSLLRGLVKLTEPDAPPPAAAHAAAAPAAAAAVPSTSVLGLRRGGRCCHGASSAASVPAASINPSLSTPNLEALSSCPPHVAAPAGQAAAPAAANGGGANGGGSAPGGRPANGGGSLGPRPARTGEQRPGGKVSK